MKTLHNIRVAGVTYDGRQEHLAKLEGNEPVRLVPEPTNAYDPNAIAVMIAVKGEVLHCGYIPKELAKDIAKFLDGESLDCSIEAVTGGFLLSNGDTAAFGLRLKIEFPSEESTQDVL